MSAVDTANEHGQGNRLTRDAAAKALANRGAEGDKLLEYLGTKTDEELAALKSIPGGDDPDNIYEYLRKLYDDDRGEVMQALNKLFPASCFKYGTLPDMSLRSTTRPLTATELSQAGLGGCMKWVGREPYQDAVNNSLEKIHKQWQMARGGITCGDPETRVIVRIAIAGPPGMGKTSMAERMMMDAADQVGPTELQSMLQCLLTYKLQYRMDFSQHPPLKDEQLGGLIRPAQAFALRTLYMFCHETGQSYAEFVEALKQHEDQQSVGVLLSGLRARHVIKAARAALLPEGCETVALHIILENFSSGCELGKEDQDKPDSTVTWAKNLLRAQALDWLFEDDLLLVSCVCTSFVKGLRGGQSRVVTLFGLFPEDFAEICAGFQQRLYGRQVKLPMLPRALERWSMGSPGQFAYLLTAAAKWAQQAGLPLEPTETDEQMLAARLRQMMGQPDVQFDMPGVLDVAVSSLTKELSWDKWLEFEQGRLIKILMAYHGLWRVVTPDQPVDPRFMLYEGGPAVLKGNTPLTFGMLEGLSLAVLFPSKGDTEESIVELPPLVLKAFHNMAIQNNWLSPGEQYLFESIYTSLQPDVIQETLSYISIRAWATQLLDGSQTCTIKHLLKGTMPEGSDALKSVLDLEVLLPDGLVLKPLDAPNWKSPDVVRREIAAARAGQRFAYKGAAYEKYWLFLKTTVAHPSLVIIRAHGLPSVYSQADIERVTNKHKKRLEIDDDIESGFMFITGAKSASDEDSSGSSSSSNDDDDGEDDDKPDDGDDEGDRIAKEYKMKRVGTIETETSYIRMFVM